MSKRFTETGIWKDPWFRKLPCKYKMFWKYITEQCDEAGIWKPDFELASFYIGEEIDTNEATKVFNEGKQRIIVIDNKDFLICDFISFQYGELKRDYNPHKKAINLLDKRNLSLNLQERLVQACGKLLNKDMDMVKDKKKVKEKLEIGDSKGKEDVNQKEKIPYEEIINNLNTQLNTSYKYDTGDIQELIKGRWEDGFREQDFTKVVSTMKIKWENNPDMSQYLTPYTLFRKSKFQKYLNMKITPTDLGKVSVRTARNIEVGKKFIEEMEKVNA